MIKFKSKEDKIQFLIEANRLDLVNKEVNEEELQELWQGIIKRRRRLKKILKDKKRSEIQKANWRKYRAKYLRAIRQFHRSVSGKRFHRALARFLTLRYPLNSESISLSIQERFEFLKLLSSLKTHLYIEGVYYKPLLEEVEYELLLEELLPLLEDIEKKVLLENKLSKGDFEFLFYLLQIESLDYETAIEKVKQGYLYGDRLVACYQKVGNFIRKNDLKEGYIAFLSYENNEIIHSILLSPDKKEVWFDSLGDRLVKYDYPYLYYKPFPTSATISRLKIVKEKSVKDFLSEVSYGKVN